MSKTTVEMVTKVIAREQKCDPESITPTTRLADLGIDSLKAITILYELEEEFDVEIPNEVIETIDSVGDIVSRLEELASISSA